MRARISVEWIPAAEERERESVRRQSVTESVVGSGLGRILPNNGDQSSDE